MYLVARSIAGASAVQAWWVPMRRLSGLHIHSLLKDPILNGQPP